MPLQPGRTLAHYEIVEPLGKGGMGEVYKARDTRLDRTVAIKVLPSDLAADRGLRERFEREARAVSALNHPHICTLHDIGHENGIDYMVLEHIDGETLAERLRRGPLPLEETLSYGIQIADALDKAHRSGIVHRDLKPGNIILAESGAKLLDFGLAMQAPVRESGSSLPTAAKPLTAEGAILGTIQYMAPEQLEGKEADARTDIFALGAVLYEMVTGEKALRDSLPDIEKGAAIPPLLDHVIRRCLAKDPQKRWQAASDVGLELKYVAEAGHRTPVPIEHKSRGQWIAWGVAAVALAIAASTLFTSPAPTPVRHLSLQIEADEELITGAGYFGAISPDGTLLVYRARRDGIRRLWKRRLDERAATPIGGSENAGPPFFSPDGEWIGFTAGGELKKVAVAGGAPIPLTKGAWSIAGATWISDDAIIFGDRASGLWRVPASGGKAEPLTTVDPEGGVTGHVWPEITPRGEGVLFALATGARDENRLAALSLRSGEVRVLQHGTQPRFAATGQLLFARDDTLWAAGFDERTFQILGTPTPVVENVRVNLGHGTTHYTLSNDGTLVYLPAGDVVKNSIVWVDDSGSVTPIVEDGLYGQPRLSPNGRALAVTSRVEGGSSIWTLDLAKKTRLRLSVESELNNDPIWTPDGSRIAFSSYDSGVQDLYWQRADGSRPAERLLPAGGSRVPQTFSPDGRFLIFAQSSEGQWDLYALDTVEKTARPIMVTPFVEFFASLSPDGRHLAYSSNESGRFEVYVQPFPELGEKIPISNDGGTEPVWDPGGKALFYRNADALMAVRVQHEPSFEFTAPERLFEAQFLATAAGAIYRVRQFDVASDGERFVMVRGGSEPTELRVVLNFFRILEDRVPPR